MADPVTLGVIGGSAVASALMQYYLAEKAAKATRERLAQIEAMFNKIVPPDYNIKVWDDPKLVATIPAPAFNTDAITPQDYKVVGQYIPVIQDHVRETNPELLQGSAQAKEGRQAQLDALSRYKRIAAGGQDPEFALLQQQAADRNKREGQSRVASTLQSFERRGALDSGLQAAAQLQGGSDAMQRGAAESQLAAVQAYKNRLNALDRSSEIGSQVNQQEMATEGKNVGIINDFNQRTSAAYQQWLQQRAALQNAAQLQNLQTAQRVSDANVAGRNEAAVANVQRQNDLAQRDYQNKNQNRQNAIQVEQYKNKLKGNMFDDQYKITSGRVGIMENGMNNARQDARDQNQMIQGLGNAATTGALYYGGVGQPAKADPRPNYAGAPSQGSTTGYAGQSAYQGAGSPLGQDPDATNQYPYKKKPLEFDEWAEGG